MLFMVKLRMDGENDGSKYSKFVMDRFMEMNLTTANPIKKAIEINSGC